MKKGEVLIEEMMARFAERIEVEMEECPKREVFEANNKIHSVEQNVMSVPLFFSRRLKLAPGVA